ncbi:MAG: alginate export family protein [Bacteroidia bacterium]|nr:alginate export family protein [Bacteroidia bacterium]
MQKSKFFFLTLALLLSYNWIFSQENKEVEEKKEIFSIGLEFRPRTEFRNGYRQIRRDTTHAAVFTEGRSRLYLNYERKGFIFHTSIQDVRIWGQYDPRSTEGTLQVFEAYVEPTLKKGLSVRIGRQKIMYDNQRLFAQNDWRQTAGAHDGVRFMYKKKTFEGDLIGVFNQEKGAHERFFETDFSPGFSNYKILLANFLRYKTGKITLTAINASDAFQDADDIHLTHWRFTSGGRIEYTQKKVYLTLAAYYQYGKTPKGENLSAGYIQPEVQFKDNKHWTLRLGAEVFSGDDGRNPDNTSHSFDALYGVNHRFLGSMDFFTRFPDDFNNAGIVAPYLFVFYDVNKKLTLRADGHLFYSQNHFVPEGDYLPIRKYLGFENDLLLRYRPNSYTEIDLGYSYAIVTESMEYIRKGGNSDLFQSWAFLMITFKPELFRWTNTN